MKPDLLARKFQLGGIVVADRQPKRSHPGNFLDFSREDLTTMEAVEAGTGKAFKWTIVTESGFLSREGSKDSLREDSPWWLEVLRKLSYGDEFKTRKEKK